MKKIIGLLIELRYVALVAVVFSILNSFTMLGLGIHKAYRAYRFLLGIEPLNEGELPGLLLAQSIDQFLIALVFLVLGLGLAQLFLLRDEQRTGLPIPSWMSVTSFLGLKLLLWEAILTVLVVVFMERLMQQGENLQWQILIIPASIFMLTISLFIMKRLAHGEEPGS